MNPVKIHILGMELEEWRIDSCVAHFGVGENWATLYDIESEIKRHGHATNLLLEAKAYYERQGKKFLGTVALNPGMKRIYQKLKIKELK